MFSSAGVVDEDYRGNVGVVLFNFGKETFEGEGLKYSGVILTPWILY